MYDSLLPKRSKDNGDDNLIPLINIVFLLLIFFMVAGQISNITDSGIEPPVSASEKPVEKAKLEVVLTAGGTLLLDDQPLSLEDLTAAVQANMAEAPEIQVALKADRSVVASELDPVLTVFRELGVSTITLYALQAEAQ